MWQSSDAAFYQSPVKFFRRCINAGGTSTKWPRQKLRRRSLRRTKTQNVTQVKAEKDLRCIPFPVLTPGNWQLLCLRRLTFIIICVRSVIPAPVILWCLLVTRAGCTVPAQQGGVKCLWQTDSERKTSHVKPETFFKEVITKHSFLPRSLPPSFLFGASPAGGTPGDLRTCLRLQNRLVCQSAEKAWWCWRLTNKLGTLL